MMSQHNCTGQYRPIYGTPMTKQTIFISGHSMQCILSVDVFCDKWEPIQLELNTHRIINQALMLYYYCSY